MEDSIENGHHSSSKKHKHKHHKHHKSSKHHKKDKEKHHHHSSKDKDRKSSHNNNVDNNVNNNIGSYHSSDDKVKREIKKEEQSDDEGLGASYSPSIPNNHTVKKEESDSEDDVPLSARMKKEVKKENHVDRSFDNDDGNSSSSDTPLAQKIKTHGKKRSRKEADSDEDSDYADEYYKKQKKNARNSTSNKKIKRSSSVEKKISSSGSKTKSKSSSKRSSSGTPSPTKKAKKQEDEEVWKWWEEAPRDDGVKWNFLEHKGPVFAPPYERLPSNIHFRYNGKVVKLSKDAEEIAGFYSRFIEHEYTTKDKFNENFFKDWRKSMNSEERSLITDLKLCDFREINDYYKMKSEERKAMSKEEKQKLKEENEQIANEYGVCTLDGHKEKIGNFRIEPPGLFRGRGDHPKMGMLKKRIFPEDVIINCSTDSKYPKAPDGRKWKEIRHDNTVTWLACWIENVQGQTKYVMLNPTSRLKGEKDWLKYEKARELAKHIDKIRENYKVDFKSKEMRVRQRAVALYFIDILALRAGNEKDEDQADTVGCCSLRVEHIQLHEEKDGKEFVVSFDFLGKDSIRYTNEVPVEKRVFKNLKIFMENKRPGDDLFDRLNTQILNKHLNELMNGLTAKVFRTYNASHTLQRQLEELTPKDKKATVVEKVLAYNRANRAVAVLCNHQRAVPKSHEKSMENLDGKIDKKRADLKALKKELKRLTKGTKDYEKKHNAVKRTEDQLKKLELSKTDKEEGKEIALGTSKLNYLDPRITVAWCKKHDVPIEKVYNKTQRAKFRWAIDMADEDYEFD